MFKSTEDFTGIGNTRQGKNSEEIFHDVITLQSVTGIELLVGRQGVYWYILDSNYEKVREDRFLAIKIEDNWIKGRETESGEFYDIMRIDSYNEVFLI